MLCAISGQVPQDPVVAVKTGLLYERRLVTKAIETNGQCPVTGTPLSVDEDLLSIKPSPVPAPRPPEGTSVAGLLSKFQSEWDALMLETFKLRQQLQTTRTELAQALYQHDAACRVIARITKERDEARQLLTMGGGSAAVTVASAAAAPAAANGDVEMEGAEGSAAVGLSDELRTILTDKSKVLSKMRKKYKKKPLIAAVEPGALQEWGVAKRHTLHKTTSPGIACVETSKQEAGVVATGGNDGDVILFDHSSGKVRSKLSGHKKAITCVALHPSDSIVVSASVDKTVCVWTGDDEMNYSAAHVLDYHTGAVSGLAMHPTGDVVATASADKTWGLADIRLGQHVLSVDSKPANYSCVEFHPDGLLLGVGAQDNVLQVWDVLSGALATDLVTGAAVTCIAFSENGYYMATGGQDSTVSLWDLRKIGSAEQIVHSFSSLNGPVGDVCFDSSGSYLAFGHGSQVSVHGVKSAEFEELMTQTGHKKQVTGVSFASDTSYLASVSLDRALYFYGN
jgi:pre-mRNA-processing factor 19